MWSPDGTEKQYPGHGNINIGVVNAVNNIVVQVQPHRTIISSQQLSTTQNLNQTSLLQFH
jgi:hypothetical protein